jgi:hypothetical protein
MSSLKSKISDHWNSFQRTLFPLLEEHLETPFTPKLMQFIAILDLVRIESFVPDMRGCVGRPPKSRKAIARAFIAKAVFGISTTVLLIDRLHSDKNLRKICGFETRFSIPSEAGFSRAFEEFAVSELPQKTHEAIIEYYYEGEIVAHVSTDATAISAREKAIKSVKNVEEEVEIKKGPKKRAAKGSVKPTRIERQASGTMTLDEMIKELPTDCNIGRKTSASGHMYAWIGYKLHLTVDDNSIPLAAMISSASMNDSQAAIPLAIITAKRVTSLYDLMDSGYYANAISEHSKSLGHVPIIDFAAKGDAQKKEKEQEKLARKTLNWEPAEAVRYNTRTSVERTNGRLKDEFGALNVRVKGHIKVFAHLMYGILAVVADLLLKIHT